MNIVPYRCLRRMVAVIAGVLIPATVLGQTWRSTLFPENWQRPGESVSFTSDKLIQDFSYAGYKRGEQAIPNVVGPVFNVTTYGADATGVTDSTVAIQNAINAAATAGGGVVLLPTGQFRVSPQGTNTFCLRISTSNIVLRGAGTASTFLFNTSYTMRDKTVIRVSSPSLSYGTTGSLTADLPGPTRRIPVQNASSFAPGNIVRLQWNFTDEWITENNQETWWNATNGRPSSASYFREVTATNPTQGWIEIDVPTRYSMKMRDSARVQKLTGFLSGVGIESLAIGNLQHPGTGWGETDHSDPTKAAYDTDRSYLITTQNVRDSWISSVHSRQATGNTSTCHMLSNGILLFSSMRVTVQNCEMRRPQYGGGNGNGYMYRMTASNECLVKNSIADFSRHGLVISGAGTSGNVYFQCEDRETQRATGSSATGYTTSGSGSDNHSHFSHSNLWDQCHAHNSFYTAHHRTFSGSTPPHGLTSAHGVYWNTSGSGTRYANSSNPIVRSEQLHYGYVIGTKATSGTAYFARNNTGGNTAPADHLEGINQGATLFPQSLYLDQLSRRLQPAVIYRGNGATAGTAPVDAASPYAPGATVTVLGAGSLVKTGFAFAGWNTAPDGSGTTYAAVSSFAITGSTYLYAQWFAQPYTVTFNSNNGSPADPASKVVEFGSAYGRLATTSRTGYAFTGWFSALTGGNLVTSASIVNIGSNHTLHARWNGRPVVDAGPNQFVTMGAQMPWTPALISARAWYDAADSSSIVAAGNAVSEWRDKSGNAKHLSQASAAAQPTTGAMTIGGRNIIAFDGTGDFVFTSTGLGSDIPSLFIVMQSDVGLNSASTAQLPISTYSDNVSSGIGLGSSTGAFADEVLTVFDEDVGGVFVDRQAASSTMLPSIDTTAHIYSFVLSSDWHVGFDGSANLRDLTSGVRHPLKFTNSFAVGAGARTAPTMAGYFGGGIAEILGVSSALSLSDRQNVEGYLAHKWALVGNLPAAHPHKNTAPVAAAAIATLNGTASDPENNTLTHTWTVVSGPASVAFANASATGTTATFTAEGTYTLRLTSSDGFSTSFDEMVVTVGAQTYYTVAYDGNGATGGSPPVDADSPYEPGANVTVFDQGDLVKNGHTFAGWNTSANGSGSLYQPDDNLTVSSSVILHAQWIPNLYAVSFDANGGSIPDPASMQVTYAAPYGTLPSTSRAGFDFAGWFTAPVGGNLVTADSPVTSAANLTLYARWTAMIAAPSAAKHFIRGESQNLETLPLGYFQSTSSNVGTGGATGARDDRNPVFSFTLPTLPPGATLDSATFNFEITAAFDTTGGQNLPGLHAYLLESVDPLGTGTTFFYHGAQDPSANARRIGTTSVTISGTTSVSFPAGQETRSFSLTGNALTLLKSYYSGNTPTRSTAYFRFNLSVDSTTVSLRRYSVNTAVAGSSLQLVYTPPPNSAPVWAANPLIKPAATEGRAYSASLASDASDANSDPLSFAKVSGPEWLSVAGNGALSGTPTSVGDSPNGFIISVSDGKSVPVESNLDLTVQSAFDGWVTDAGGAQTFTGDANHDGVANGLAWLLTAVSPTAPASTLLPAVGFNNGDLRATFMLLSPTHRGSAVAKVQYSTDLATWTTVTVPDTSGVQDGVDFLITPVGNLLEVEVTLPAVLTGNSSQSFLRLHAELP
jgi:uncharacterized repeat protein (TIGR02543 family)